MGAGSGDAAALAERSIATAWAIARRAAASDFRGPDPYDGLWWHWPRALTGGRRRRQALVQLHARAPVDIRRLYRRTHPLIPKALGVFASVGARMHGLTGERAPLDLAVDAAGALAADRGAGARAWGYHWDVQTRWSFYPAGSPNVVVTAFAASGLLEVARLSGRDDLRRRALDAARWALEELWIEPDGYFGYHAGRPTNIHNANLLGAWLVEMDRGPDATARARVQRAVAVTLAAQREDGSWPYGEGSNLAWVDSFHTGYVLSCLDRLSAIDPRIADALRAGAQSYRTFFDADGRARLWAQRPFPEDGHSAGTGMSTLALLVRRGLVEPAVLERVVERVLRHGVRNGRAVHRRYRWGAAGVHYVRWCDAHVALGLVDAAAVLRGAADLAPRAAD